MKRLLPFRSSLRLLALLVALFAAGCVSSDQVQQIVSEGNAAALSADLNPGSASRTGSADVQAISRRIEAFIAANPEQKATNAALRVRQAVILMQNQQLNLARAAFNEAKLEDLKGSSRDRALKELQEPLLWYYGAVGGAVDPVKAKTMQDAFSTVLQRLTEPEDEGIRDFLAAIRAWIGVKRAEVAFADGEGERHLVDALNEYAKSLPPGETARWQGDDQWPHGMSFETAIAATNRRRFRAQDLIEGAKAAARSNNLRLDPQQLSDPYFRAAFSP